MVVIHEVRGKKKETSDCGEYAVEEAGESSVGSRIEGWEKRTQEKRGTKRA